MALANMDIMLRKARQGGYAVGAFNILDYQSMKVVIRTAQELKAPVIVQTSVKTVKYWGTGPVICWFRELAEEATIPAAIHLDHCKDVDFISECIDKGWTSIMIDASSFPLEKNIEISKMVLDMARPKGITVEAELGEIGGVEDDLVVAEEDAHLVVPDKAISFLEEVPVDCFAPAIGTAHGIYKGKPSIAFDRLAEIAARTDVPLALHGGTGLTPGVFKKCIGLGCAKVNISTQLKYAFIDGFTSYHNSNPEEYNPLTILSSQYQAIGNAVAENIKLFGSVNKA